MSVFVKLDGKKTINECVCLECCVSVQLWNVDDRKEDKKDTIIFLSVVLQKNATG